MTVGLFYYPKTDCLKRIAVIFFLLKWCGPIWAQQPAQYALFHLNPMLWNPAYAGLEYSLNATAGYRKQWTQLPGSPESQYFSMHLPWYIVGGGLGMTLENDVLGAGRWASAQVNYSYHLPLGNGLLSLGLGAGVVQRTLDGAQLRTPDGSYEPGAGIDHNDPLLPIAVESGNTPSFHTGIFFQSERINLGIGIRHLTAPNISMPSRNQSIERLISLQMGMNFPVGRTMNLQPHLLLRSDGRQIQTDIAATVQIQERFFTGISFRGYSTETGDAIAFMAGLPINDYLSMAYAYDITVSGLRQVSNGSHEIVLQYNLQKAIGRGRPPRIIYNPRTL